MSKPAHRLPLDLTLLDGARLASAIAGVAPWTTSPRLVVIAIAALAALAANPPTPRLLQSPIGLFTLLGVVVWVVAGIVLRELARAAAAMRTGRTVQAIRVAVRARALPAFHTDMQPAWSLASPDIRWRITAAGCVMQLGLAGVLALTSPLWGGATPQLAALALVALALWTALTGERTFLQRTASMRGAVIARVEATPTAPKPVRRGTARGDRGLGWFLLIGFGVPGLLCTGYGLQQSLVQEQRLRTARPVEAVVVATALTDRTQQKRGVTYRPEVRHAFRLDGRAYESVRTHPLPQEFPQSRAKRFLETYPAGARVTTYVPEGDPSGAYLVPARQWRFPAMALFGLLFAVPGITAWILLMRAAGRRTPEAGAAGPSAASPVSGGDTA